MLLATGGEFAFVAFGEAVAKGVLPAQLTSELYMVVALSMAMVPYLAALGGKLGGLFERSGALRWMARARALRTLHALLVLPRVVLRMLTQLSRCMQVLTRLVCPAHRPCTPRLLRAAPCTRAQT